MTFQQRNQNALVILWWTQLILTWSTGFATYPASPGSPLSEEEYEQFIKLIQPEWKAKHLCEIRRGSGCTDPQVFGFDLVENHGQIPKGTVCTELDTFPRFDSFCHFAMFRCTENQFYIKRIPCSDLLLDLSNFSEEMFTPPTPPVFPYTSASRVTQRRAFDRKNEVEQLSSQLRSLTDKLLVFSFTVCNQQPIRRNQQNLPKSMGAPRVPSRTKGRFTQTDQGQKNLKGDLNKVIFQQEPENLAIPDHDDEVEEATGPYSSSVMSDYDGGEETDSAGSDFKPKKKYKAAVSLHMKGKNPKITAVSYHHQDRKDTVDSPAVPGHGSPANTPGTERNQGKTGGANTTMSRKQNE
ncbi:acrosin-binding protein [Rhinoderma darwinii]|uniref:acrosin-binding protein n=1 Tax=Rhinoderma darwinii TaxID=43563 RepID=UPI003F66FEC4